MCITPQNMLQTSNSLLSPTKSMVLLGATNSNPSLENCDWSMVPTIANDTSYVYPMCTRCVPYMHPMCTLYTPSVHLTCTICAPYMYPTCNLCVPYMHLMCTLHMLLEKSDWPRIPTKTNDITDITTSFT